MLLASHSATGFSHGLTRLAVIEIREVDSEDAARHTTACLDYKACYYREQQLENSSTVEEVHSRTCQVLSTSVAKYGFPNRTLSN